MYLLDTNIISQLAKARPNAGAVRWLNGVDQSELRLSVVTIAEIVKGYASLRRRDLPRAKRLANWCAALETQYGERILPFDTSTARQCGEYLAAFPNMTAEDAIIAGTARVNSLILVTHNTGDFVETGITLINPFD